MHRTILFTILFATSQITSGQKFLSTIDSLHSESDVQELVNSLTGREDTFRLTPIAKYRVRYAAERHCKRIADSLNITQSFYKSDFDKNGYTDLLVIGQYDFFKVYIVMNHGRDSLKLMQLTRRSFQGCTFPKIINDSIIRYYYLAGPMWEEKEQPALLYKDLIFKFGDFIEYNPKPKKHSIEKIEYYAGPCFGFCPEFNISIDNDRSSIYRETALNDSATDYVTKVFKATINKDSYSAIIDLLNYIDFPQLNDHYKVNWTDDRTCSLTITYNDGKVKKITDYGLIGTYGLDRVYQLFFNLRTNQDWKKFTVK